MLVGAELAYLGLAEPTRTLACETPIQNSPSNVNLKQKTEVRGQKTEVRRNLLLCINTKFES